MSAMQIETLVKSSALLASLTPEDCVHLAEQSTRLSASRGEVLWLGSSQIDHFGLVEKGFVKMGKSTSAGRESLLEIMGPSEIFGLNGILEGKGCPLNAVAMTDVVWLRCSGAAIHTIAARNQSFRDDLLRNALVRLHSVTDRMPSLATGSTEQRLAAAILYLQDSMAKGQATIKITRQDLAGLASTTTETAIRVTKAWERQGLIRVERGALAVVSRDALEEMIEG